MLLLLFILISKLHQWNVPLISRLVGLNKEDVSKDSAAVLDYTLATDATAEVKRIAKAWLRNW